MKNVYIYGGPASGKSKIAYKYAQEYKNPTFIIGEDFESGDWYSSITPNTDVIVIDEYKGGKDFSLILLTKEGIHIPADGRKAPMYLRPDLIVVSQKRPAPMLRNRCHIIQTENDPLEPFADRPVFDRIEHPRQASVADILDEAKELATWYNIDLETALQAYDIMIRDSWRQLAEDITEGLVENIKGFPMPTPGPGFEA